MSTEREVVAEVLLTRDEVADRLKVSTRTVDRYIAGGDLAAVKLRGRVVRVRESELLKLTNGTPDVADPLGSVGGSSSSAKAPAA